MKTFNKIAIALYIVAFLIFLPFFVSQLVETNIGFLKYLDSLDSNPGVEKFILFIFVPIGLILGLIAYATSYKAIWIKLSPFFILIVTTVFAYMGSSAGQDGFQWVLSALMAMGLIYGVFLYVLTAIVRRFSVK